MGEAKVTTDQATGAQSEAINAGLEKVGKTIGKLALGIFGFLGGIAEKVSPLIMELATNVLARLAESYANKILKKNGVDV